MFKSTVQPALVSLFSSVGSDPLQLFSVSVDPALPSDSIIHLLSDQTSLPLPESDAQLIALPRSDNSDDDSRPDSLACTVLHIQSPTVKTTSIRCPSDSSKSLGLTHQWFHLQFRDIGREFSFEIGLCDTAGRTGVVRCSTFQDDPRIESFHPPLLHVPLSTSQSNATTHWRTISIDLSTVLSHFTNPNTRCEIEGSRPNHLMPSGRFGHTTYVKVYANCRLRRLWFSRTSDGGADRAWEFGMYTNTG
ncbi:hypothetical protein BDV93DRAFT_439659 [Ceratobasidium sp. AG-I]|nr:hypothetical protein BDV93DRAFT_439659 [Ceratobasidium sp. AG-I]